jgi:hypothetical protein
MHQIHVEKPPLSKKRAYVLKTSVLQRALAEAKIDCHVSIRYWTPRTDGSILEAEYWLPNQNVPYPRVNVRAGSLPKEERRAAFRWLEERAVPSFIHWVTKVLALPDNSPILLKGASFTATYRRGAVEIRHDFTQSAV